MSVGLPVFNGEHFLPQALDAMMAQTFDDFELIISDNASTDGTAEICRAYAGSDARIRYRRFETNQGAARNFNHLVTLARAPYFKWMAHDDLHDVDFLRRCVAVLDADPSVVLSYTRAVDIDADGEVLGAVDVRFRGEAPPHVRFRDCLFPVDSAIPIFGVVRTDVLRRTPLIRPYTASDRVLLAEIALHGRCVEVPDVLFFRRQHGQRSVQATADGKERLAWFDPSRTWKRELPTLRRGAGYLMAVLRAPLRFSERLACYGQVVGLLGHDGARRRLLLDVKDLRLG